MTDSSIPLSLTELEQAVQEVAHSLLEKWAIEDRFTEEQMLDYVQYSVDDTAFVINSYMQAMNNIMITKAQQLKIINDFE
jgi:hypothetical protein